MLQFQDSSHIEIIETYWNVNVILAISLILFPSEIIETYWNVNESKIRQKAFFRIEIIETYWNVNYVLKMADLGQVMK